MHITKTVHVIYREKYGKPIIFPAETYQIHILDEICFQTVYNMMHLWEFEFLGKFWGCQNPPLWILPKFGVSPRQKVRHRYEIVSWPP